MQPCLTCVNTYLPDRSDPILIPEIEDSCESKAKLRNAIENTCNNILFFKAVHEGMFTFFSVVTTFGPVLQNPNNKLLHQYTYQKSDRSIEVHMSSDRVSGGASCSCKWLDESDLQQYDSTMISRNTTSKFVEPDNTVGRRCKHTQCRKRMTKRRWGDVRPCTGFEGLAQGPDPILPSFLICRSATETVASVTGVLVCSDLIKSI